jgi:hypothetical protein
LPEGGPGAVLVDGGEFEGEGGKRSEVVFELRYAAVAVMPAEADHAGAEDLIDSDVPRRGLAAGRGRAGLRDEIAAAEEVVVRKPRSESPGGEESCGEAEGGDGEEGEEE